LAPRSSIIIAMAAEQKAKFSPAVRLRKFFLPGWIANRRVRITLSGWIYNGLIFVFGLSAINTGNNLLYLILAVMITLMLASSWLSEMSLAEIKISRELPEGVFSGEEFLVSYELENLRRFWPAAGIEVKEKFEGKSAAAYFPLVRAGKSESVYSRVSLTRRGRYKLRELLVGTAFPFGFFEKSKKITIGSEMVVLPSEISGKDESDAGAAQIGVIRPGQKGLGSELFGFREYVPGDHPHWIDWKASAKTSRLLIQETEREAEQAVIITLNLPVRRPDPDSEPRERLISKAYGLAKSFIALGWRVRVQIQERGVDFETGINHLRTIAYFLALFDDQEEPQLGGQLSPPNFPAREIVLEQKPL